MAKKFKVVAHLPGFIELTKRKSQNASTVEVKIGDFKETSKKAPWSSPVGASNGGQNGTQYMHIVQTGRILPRSWRRLYPAGRQ
jgi:hypothetical protein